MNRTALIVPTLRFSSLLLAALLAAPLCARADVVPQPNQACPAGSTANTSHCGLFCQPTSCTTDADCTMGKVCQETPLCIRQIPCSNRLPDAGTFYIDDATSACPKGDECAAPAACKSAKRCVAAPVPQSSGCSLQASTSRISRTVPGAALLLLLAVGALLVTRRRR